MCGITGFTGKKNTEVIKRMARTLAHRGPDDEGFLTRPELSFGMRRLSIIDIKGGQQPIFNEDGTIAVVYNGEIFNFQELRQNLKQLGHHFRTQTDTEVIVHLYEEKELDFAKELNGMFAIALWDAKSKQIVLARDQMGIKPLYYSVINGNLVFGSEIKAILAYPSVKKDIDLQSLRYYLAFRHIPAPATIFQNIYSLRPGEIVIWKNKKLSVKSYWRLNLSEPIGVNERQAADKILEILRDSVQRRLVADVDVGSYLSGGLDSSLVTALASREIGGRLKTFSLTYKDHFRGKEADREAARLVSKRFKTEHYEYVLDAKELEQDLPAIIASFDEPFAAVVSTYFISKLIGKHVKVALSGDGADELFGSYLSHRLAAGAEIRPGIERKKPWQWRAELLTWKDGEKILAGNEKFETSEALFKKEFQRFKIKDLLNNVLAAEFVSIFPDQVLAFVDRLSMAHSIEVRPPYLDLRLVDFAFSLPGKMKIKNGEVKHILKLAAQKILPKEIVYRKKEGFILPLNAWLSEKLRPFVMSVLAPKRLVKHGFFNLEAAADLLKRKDWSVVDTANKIWTLVVFQIWWEKYFD